MNALETTGGDRTVMLERVDEHLTLESQELVRRIDRCRLRDTDPSLEGPKV